MATKAKSKKSKKAEDVGLVNPELSADDAKLQEIKDSGGILAVSRRFFDEVAGGAGKVDVVACEVFELTGGTANRGVYRECTEEEVESAKKDGDLEDTAAGIKKAWLVNTENRHRWAYFVPIMRDGNHATMMDVLPSDPDLLLWNHQFLIDGFIQTHMPDPDVKVE